MITDQVAMSRAGHLQLGHGHHVEAAGHVPHHPALCNYTGVRAQVSSGCSRQTTPLDPCVNVTGLHKVQMKI